ncbi:MAG: mechanosensitive ion channel [Prevotellaceae bacterium]|nr:mechanosensitive ion channel [Prevotellaceae bacterium]
MMHFLQADSIVTEAAKEAEVTTKAILSGDTTALQHLGQQCLNVCVEVGKSIILAVLIYIIGRFIIRGINALLARTLERRHVDLSLQSFLKSMVNIVLTILLLVSVVGALGVNTASFAALIAAIGIAFGMALSGNLQNMAGGFVILVFKPFRVGDSIEAMGTVGTVKEIQMFHTIVLTADNKTVFLPNGALSSGSVVNASLSEVRRVDLTYKAAYGQDPEEVKAALKEIIAACDKVLTDAGHEPFIALSEIGGNMTFTVRLWTKGADYWAVYYYMQQTVFTTFNKKGIKFP